MEKNQSTGESEHVNAVPNLSSRAGRMTYPLKAFITVSLLGGDGQRADVVANGGRGTPNGRSRTSLQTGQLDHGGRTLVKWRAQSPPPDSTTPRRNVTSPGQRRSCVGARLGSKVRAGVATPSSLAASGPQARPEAEGLVRPPPGELRARPGGNEAHLRPRSASAGQKGSVPCDHGPRAGRAGSGPAPERALCPAPAAPSGVDVSHGNAGRARAPPCCAGPLGAAAPLPPRSGCRQPPGGSAQPGFTCKNAVPGMPSRRLCPRVTRGTFDPRHRPGDFVVALVSKPVQSHVVLAILTAAGFSFLVKKPLNAIIALFKI